MFLGIPLNHWIIYGTMALSLFLWSVLAIYNTFDSFFGLKLDTAVVIGERDKFREQAEEYAERLSRCEVCLGIALAANDYMSRDLADVTDDYNNQRNRANGLEQQMLRVSGRLDEREADNKELRETNRLLRQSLEAQ